MATPPAPTPAPDPALASPPDRGARRVVVLTTVPLGLFVVAHLGLLARALGGRDAFDRALGGLHRVRGLAWLEAALVALPLALGAAWGARRSLRAWRAATARGARLLVALHAASGLFLLGFVAQHVARYRARRGTGAFGAGGYYHRIERDLNTPGLYALYLLGVSAAAYHLGHAVFRAGEAFGLYRSPRARRSAAWACGALGLAVWALGVNTLWHFALRCGGVLPLPGRRPLAELCGSLGG